MCGYASKDDLTELVGATLDLPYNVADVGSEIGSERKAPVGSHELFGVGIALMLDRANLPTWT